MKGSGAQAITSDRDICKQSSFLNGNLHPCTIDVRSARTRASFALQFWRKGMPTTHAVREHCEVWLCRLGNKTPSYSESMRTKF